MADAKQPRILGKDQPRTVFVLRHRFQKPPEEFEAAYAGHRAHVKRHLDAGRFIAGGPTVPWDGGMILAVATDLDEIERVVAEDSLVDAGISVYEIAEWKTTMRSEDFEALLDGLDPSLSAPAASG